MHAALSKLVHCAASDQSFKSNDELVSRCRSLANTLNRLGVSGDVPSRAEIASDQIAQHQAEDRLMVSLAQAVFALILPTERSGYRSLLRAWRENIKPSVLFEKAIANFYTVELPEIPGSDGWRVHKQKHFDWPIETESQGNAAYLPIMKTDIFLKNEKQGRRIVIDTKFKTISKKTNLVSRNSYRRTCIRFIPMSEVRMVSMTQCHNTRKASCSIHRSASIMTKNLSSKDIGFDSSRSI